MEDFTGAKYGIQTVNIEGPSGNVTINIKIKKSAKPHIFMRTRLKKCLLKSLIA